MVVALLAMCCPCCGGGGGSSTARPAAPPRPRGWAPRPPARRPPSSAPCAGGRGTRRLGPGGRGRGRCRRRRRTGRGARRRAGASRWLNRCRRAPEAIPRPAMRAAATAPAKAGPRRCCMALALARRRWSGADPLLGKLGSRYRRLCRRRQWCYRGGGHRTSASLPPPRRCGHGGDCWVGRVG